MPKSWTTRIRQARAESPPGAEGRRIGPPGMTGKAIPTATDAGNGAMPTKRPSTRAQGPRMHHGRPGNGEGINLRERGESTRYRMTGQNPPFPPPTTRARAGGNEVPEHSSGTWCRMVDRTRFCRQRGRNPRHQLERPITAIPTRVDWPSGEHEALLPESLKDREHRQRRASIPMFLFTFLPGTFKPRNKLIINEVEARGVEPLSL